MSEVGLTIKEGKGYEESWHTFRGTPEEIREDLIAYFGMDLNHVGGMTSFEVSTEARRLAQGGSQIIGQLGGRVIGGNDKPSGPTGASAWDKVDGEAGGEQTQAPQENPNLWLIEALGKAADLDALKKLWAENQGAFSDAPVADAYKARGKALSAAA